MRSDYQSSHPTIRAAGNALTAPKRGSAPVLTHSGADDVLGLVPRICESVPTVFSFLPPDVSASTFDAFRWIDSSIHQQRFDSLEDLSGSLTKMLVDQIPASMTKSDFEHIKSQLSITAINDEINLVLDFEPTLYSLPGLHKSSLPKPLLNYIIHTIENLPFVHYMAITPSILPSIAAGSVFMGMDSDEEYIGEMVYTMDEQEADEWLKSNPLLPSHLEKKFKPYTQAKRISYAAALRSAKTEQHRKLLNWAKQAAKGSLIESQRVKFTTALHDHSEQYEYECPYEYPPLFLDMTNEPEFVQVVDELHNEIMQGDSSRYFELHFTATNQSELQDQLALIEALHSTLREIDFLIELTHTTDQ